MIDSNTTAEWAVLRVAVTAPDHKTEWSHISC